MIDDKPDALDRLIDNALASYSGGEPLAGLEERVMQRVRAQGAFRRFALGKWALALAAVALAGLVIFFRPPNAAKPVAPAVVAAKAAAPILLPAAPTPAVRVIRTSRRALPKQAEFPRPVPVTGEERALLALADQPPDQGPNPLIAWQPRTAQPIQIDEITIEPLRREDAK
jgi:hypothetical protein